MREYRARAADVTALLYEQLDWLTTQRSELESLRARVREAERKTAAPCPKRKRTAAAAVGAGKAKASARHVTRPARDSIISEIAR